MGLAGLVAPVRPPPHSGGAEQRPRLCPLNPCPSMRPPCGGLADPLLFSLPYRLDPQRLCQSEGERGPGLGPGGAG